MACEPCYTDCISRRPERIVGAELALLQWVGASNRCVSADLGRFGQSAIRGLYSLSKHCSGDASRLPNGPRLHRTVAAQLAVAPHLPVSRGPLAQRRNPSSNEHWKTINYLSANKHFINIPHLHHVDDST